LVGWLAGTGIVGLPALGAWATAGPLMATLSGIGVGGLLCGAVGALIGVTLPEYEAKRYDGKIREGNILLSAHCGFEGQANRAREIFEQAGACDIASSAEVGVSRSELGSPDRVLNATSSHS